MNSLDFYKDGSFMESILDSMKKFDKYTSDKNEKLEVKRVKFNQDKDYNIASFNLSITTASKSFSQKTFSEEFQEKLKSQIVSKSVDKIVPLKIEVISDTFKRFSKSVRIDEESFLVNYTSVSYNVRVVLK